MWRVILSVFVLLFSHQHLRGNHVRGLVTDAVSHEPLPYANVYVKGGQSGTVTNGNGAYDLFLPDGDYTIVFRYLGYRSTEKLIQVKQADIELNVGLFAEKMELNTITVKAGDEDPAYPIIREAIKKRSYYQNQVKAYSCQVYIKGVQRLIEMPERIMGLPTSNIIINGMAANDSNLQGIIYLSESVSKFSYAVPGKIQEEMISSRVSGKNNAFSYNKASDMLYDFYQNKLHIDAISERDFISPIAYNAMFYYRYKLLGAYVEDGYLINKIQVIPRRKHDPCFSGNIYIVEKEWRLHSINVVITSNAQIDFVDTLRLQQVFAPLTKEVWMPVSNRFDFSFNVIGIRGNGYYQGINSHYNLQPGFTKKTFYGPQWKVLDESNKKDSVYWDSIRPYKLTEEERTDYRKKDSMQTVFESKTYLDSLDKKFNKPGFFSLLVSGYGYKNRYRKEVWSISGLAPSFQFNTVEGAVVNLNMSYDKRTENKQRFFLSPTFRYGFSNGHFNPKLIAYKLLNNENFTSVFINGGSDVMQFNNQQPITPFLNTFYTLLNEQNFMKTYEKIFVRGGYRQEVTNGVYLRTEAEWAHRYALQNTSYYKLVDDVYGYFTSNDPRDTANYGPSFKPHQAFSVTLSAVFRFKQTYDLRPNQKIITGSKYPSLTLYYKKGISQIGGSGVNYDFIRAMVKDDMHLGLWGTLSYQITVGGFINTRNMYFMDYYHVNGNRTFALNKLKDPGDVGGEPATIAGFMLCDYYVFSTTKPFFEAHAEHHFNGFLVNKLPLLRKARLQEVLGVHYLLCNQNTNYAELSIGIEHIGLGDFMPGFLRIDYVSSFTTVYGQLRHGIRFGLGF